MAAPAFMVLHSHLFGSTLRDAVSTRASFSGPLSVLLAAAALLRETKVLRVIQNLSGTCILIDLLSEHPALKSVGNKSYGRHFQCKKLEQKLYQGYLTGRTVAQHQAHAACHSSADQ